MRVKRCFLFICVSLILLLPGVSDAKASDSFPRELVDDFGDRVVIKKKPERIVSLSPTNTEILFAIGAQERIVGVTDYCDFPPRAREIDSIGGYSTPNIEAIVAKDPDLIVASYGNGEENIKRLRELGFPVLALHPHSLRGVLTDIELVGKATGYEKEAKDLVEKLKERIDKVRKKGMDIPEEKKPSVLWLMWYPDLWTAGAGTFFDELVQIAGGKNIAHDLDGWKRINKEVVLARNPQIIICSRMGEKKGFLSQVIEDPQLKRTAAVKNGHVHEINADLLELPGPRIVEGLEKISGYIQDIVVNN